MTKKLLISLSVIGIAAVIAVSGTTAYFSDTEEGVDNVFAAGTVDIWLGNEDESIWEGHAIMEDMKPCYTDYVNFTIYNDDSESANPVNVYKRLHNIVHDTGVVSEPECTDQGGVYVEGDGEPHCDFGNCDDSQYRCDDKNNIASIIEYDLVVEVYDSEGRIWWQTIYDKEVTIGEIKNTDMYLGMIPAGGYMKVTQSYHMKDPDYPTNWAQGDTMNFDIEIKAEQLRGEAWLENKEGADPWKIIQDDDIEGTLTYEVKSPEFEYSFEGKALLANELYVLIAGDSPGGTDSWWPDTKIGEFTTGSNGEFATGPQSIDLGKDLKDAKIWAIPASQWDDSTNQPKWTGDTNWLYEIGLIWYEDTDL